ncbi:MAG: hypothetical protein NDI61_14090 [Bdellovibrionaceae bacterium]|nr:hypothetical protein [Pseudobdellovibrionaceae bacterium]
MATEDSSQIKQDRIENVHEGQLTRQIETQTAKIPSINYLMLAVGSMGISAFTSLVLKNRSLGNFFGLWVPSLLVIGMYNKLVKIEAHLDRQLMH